MSTGATSDDYSNFASLHAEAICQLERLAGRRWTDFNPQDPGITILEQCCYALTELFYRSDFPLADLLSSGGRDPTDGLYSAARILACQPVTLVDLRKLVIDVRGVRNAWIEAVGQPEAPVYLDRAGVLQADGSRRRLLRWQPGRSADSMAVRGLYRVSIEASNELGVTGDELTRNVTRRLQASRPLGMDFTSVDVLKPRNIQVKARIEIGNDADPEDVFVAILLALAQQTSPRVTFRTLAQCLAEGRTVDEIFDGPLLEQGFIDSDELAAHARKTALRVSDFIQAVMRVDQVLRVKSLSLSAAGVEQDWWLDIDAGAVPAFDMAASVPTILLERQQLLLTVDKASATERVRRVLVASAYRPAVLEERERIPPAGRDRKVASYYSIQHHFPENFALGERGLPAGAGALRRAQRKQLQAYLLLFDQLLANQYAQLAHLGDLLGFAAQPAQTCFAGLIDDPGLHLDPVWRRSDAAGRFARLEQLVENPRAAEQAEGRAVTLSPDWSRKNRLLDHLLARFAERFVDPGELLPLADAADAQARRRESARAKQAWLQGYPEYSAGRGSGGDPTRPEKSVSMLERRLHIKLGLSPERLTERLYLVEHLLLRPVAADRSPLADASGDSMGWLLLADGACADPFSLQLSLVMPGWSGACLLPTFRQFVEQTAHEEIPAHLVLRVRWLDEATMTAFADARQTWLGSLRTLILSPGGAATAAEWFRFRDARDRIIDLIGLGNTYPLADLPVVYPLQVAWGQRGSLTLPGAQPGVEYQLLAKDGTRLEPPIFATGDGNDLLLTTPPITSDVDFLLRATRLTSGLSRDLFVKPEIRVGLDQSLAASLVDGAPLDPADTAPTAARIVDFAEPVRVEVQASQAGVDYCLQMRASPWADFQTISLADVRGNAANIRLATQPMLDDGEIRILATKTFDPADHQATQIAPLNTILSLKVRADPGRGVSVAQAQVDYRGSATLLVQESQASASYQPYVRAVQDSEFVRPGSAADIAIADLDALRVTRPSVPTLDVAVAGSPVAGTGGDLSLHCQDLLEDSLIVVRASKSHTIAGKQTPVESMVQLAAAAVILVRPGTAADFPLRLRRQDGAAAAAGLQKGSVYVVDNGQAGIHYYFRRAEASDQNLGQPVYFHKLDKGIGALAVEIDFTVADGLPASPPCWDCPVDLAPDERLSIRAVKAQTGLESEFELTVATLLETV